MMAREAGTGGHFLGFSSSAIIGSAAFAAWPKRRLPLNPARRRRLSRIVPLLTHPPERRRRATSQPSQIPLQQRLTEPAKAFRESGGLMERLGIRMSRRDSREESLSDGWAGRFRAFGARGRIAVTTQLFVTGSNEALRRTLSTFPSPFAFHQHLERAIDGFGLAVCVGCNDRPVVTSRRESSRDRHLRLREILNPHGFGDIEV